MSDAAHRRYLRVMREACSAHPAAHQYQLAAIERELDCAQLDAGQFELTRCAYLDRSANALRCAWITSDVFAARAIAIEFEHCAKATGYGDWVPLLIAGSAKSVETRGHGSAAQSAFVTLLLSLIRLRGEFRAAYRGQVQADAEDAARTIIRCDPHFSWSKPRYALRLPWTGAALNLIRTWVALPDSSSPDSAPPDLRFELPARSAKTAEPGPADAGAPYRQIAESPAFPELTRAIARDMATIASSAATPQDAAAAFVTSGLLTQFAAAPLRAMAAAALERRAIWPDPLIEHHWRSLLDRLDLARTPTEVELIAAHGDACFAVEADWNTLMFSSLAAPLRAACIAGWDSSDEAREGLAGAAEVTRELTGMQATEIEGLPLVANFIREVMTPVAAEFDPRWGAYRGEPGCDLAAEARILAGAGGLRPFAGLLAGIDQERGQARPFLLWNTAIAASRLHLDLTAPARPPVPGL